MPSLQQSAVEEHIGPENPPMLFNVHSVLDIHEPPNNLPEFWLYWTATEIENEVI